MAKAHDYTLRIVFRNKQKFTPFDGTMRVSNALDSFQMTPSSLTIVYQRSRKQTISQAINSVRIAKIEELWLLYYGLTGSFPEVCSLWYGQAEELREISLSDASLPNAPACHDSPFIPSKIVKGIYDSVYRSQSVVAISYLYASKRSAEVTSRFRYLWSAFNALYKDYPSSGRAEYLHARSLLDAISKNADIERIMNHYFAQEPDLDCESWRWNDFLSGFKALSVTRKKDGTIAVSNNAELVLGDVDQDLVAVFQTRNAYAKWRNLSEEANLMKLRAMQLADGAQGNRFLFIFSFYLYWLRCDTVHGNSLYPVFQKEESRKHLGILCDTLEELVELCLLNLQHCLPSTDDGAI